MFALVLTVVLISLHFNVAIDCPDCNADLHQILTETHECKADMVVGLSVSVVRSNEVLFQRGYGLKSIDSNDSVTEHTMFGIASLSKAFASTLLVKLMEEKTTYTLDTTVSTVFGNNDIFYDSLRSKYATLRDLLAHRIGLPGNNRIRMDNNLTRANLVERLKYLKLTGGFRDSFMYSNLMYGLITNIAEKIGGDTWENLVRRYLFEPLGMTSSTFLTEIDPDKVDLADGYFEYYGEFKPVPLEFSRHWADLCGSGCVVSSSSDMTKWMKFWLNEGKLQNGSRLISEKAFKDLTRPENVIASTYTNTYFQRPTFHVTNSQTGYALGWRTGFYRGNKVLVHSGTTFGFRALLSVFPEDDIAIFTVMTGNDPNYLYRQTLHNLIYDMYSGVDPYLNTSTVCSYPEPWKNARPNSKKPNYDKERNPQRNISSYFGVYHNVAYGNIEIKPHRDNNKLTFVYGIQTCVLYPKQEKDEFYGDSTGLTKYIVNSATFSFLFKEDSISIELSFFERNDPPIFTKTYGNSVGSSCKTSPHFLLVILPYLYYSYYSIL